MTATDPQAAILAFRDAANANQDFVRYKILVGYESVFADMWDNSSTPYDEREDWRAKEIDKLVDDVSDQNTDNWLALIRRCAATKSNDLATFPPFTQFLEKLGERKPDFALRCLTEADSALARFLAALLRGLAKTPDWAKALAVVEGWVGQSRHLGEVIFAGGTISELPLDLVVRALELALYASDVDAAMSALVAVMRRFSLERTGETEALIAMFLQAARFLAAHDRHHALTPWIIHGKPSIFDAFNHAERREYLGLLVPFESWHMNLERVAVAAAGNDPELILEFLAQRAAFRQGTSAGSYDAMPFHVDEIKALLVPHIDLVLVTGLAWFKKDDWLWGHFATGLVERVYPGVGDILDPALRRLIATGNRSSVEFVVAILRAYNGRLPTLALCKEVVAALPDGDELLAEIRIAICSTGTTSGEYGVAQAYQKRREEIALWQSDDRPNIKAFADSMLHELDNDIAAETRRADASVAQRKLDFAARST